MSPAEVQVPLSAKQRYSWLEVAANPGIPSRQISATYAVHGPLDPDRLRGALRTVITHHDQLRLRVTGAPDAPVATLREPPSSPPLPLIDLTGLDGPTTAELITMYGEREASTYLDLGRDWPVRALLLRLSPTEHLLMLTVHHLVADSWSAALVVRHLGHAYRTGGLADVPTSPPYTAYVEAEAQRRSTAQHRSELRWWVETLHDVSPAPLLGSAIGPATTLDTIERHHPTPRSFRDDLRRIARPARASTYVVAVALLAAALRHRTGVARRVLLVSHLGPRLPDYEHTVGLFSNRLPLVVPVATEQSAIDVVHTVQARMLDLIDHSGPAYFELLEAAEDRNVVSAQITVQHVPPESAGPSENPRPEEFTLRFQRYRIAASALPLHLLLMEEPDGRMWWGGEFRSDVFRPAEGAALVRGVLDDVATLAERSGDPIAKALT
ncbi:condensation domain-containing protein [Actinomadura rubrisoli]|uniref:Condensation domain-containing protein n=1 Tax=Actinomadura rubrisoli TaxID=2530368 RepID=A0A4R5CD76_9ACTN|nr:condensation domain-containing protein [Actinomadura rubrisoli]TDD96806.1 hypothetical protein E1298_02150 [Actinomadura rubrisoli]